MKTPIETTNNNNDIILGQGKNQFPTPILIAGEVRDITDINDARRVKVRIKGLDDKTADENLPFCVPILPITINFNPQEREAVWVLIPDNSKPFSDRMFIGPVNSQLQRISGERFDDSAFNAYSGGKKQLKEGYSQKEESKDNFPQRNENGLIGRKNSDLRFPDNSFRLSAGNHLTTNPMQKSDNPAIITGKKTEDDVRSEIILQADYNFIISNNNKIPVADDAAKLNTFEDLLNKSERMAKGDSLIKLLEIMRQALLEHVHGYSNLSPDKNTPIVELEKFDLNQILSDNNRII